MRSSTRRTILWTLALVLGLVLVGGGLRPRRRRQRVGRHRPRLAQPAGARRPGRRVRRGGQHRSRGPGGRPDPGPLRTGRPDGPAAGPGHDGAGGHHRAHRDRGARAGRRGPRRVRGRGPRRRDRRPRPAEAYAAMARGEVDVVVGGIDGPFFDAVDGGLGARLVLGGQVARRPRATSTPRSRASGSARACSSTRTRTGTTSRARRSSSRAGSPRPPSSRSTRSWPSTRSASTPSTSCRRPRRRRPRPSRGGGRRRLAGRARRHPGGRRRRADAGGDHPRQRVDRRHGVRPRLLGADRAVGLAYVRAVIRTINTHLADGYGDDASRPWPRRSRSTRRSWPTGRRRCSTGRSVGDDHPGAGRARHWAASARAPDRRGRLVDRSLAADVVAAADQPIGRADPLPRRRGRAPERVGGAAAAQVQA